MTSWRPQIFRHRLESGEEQYAIHEVFLEPDGRVRGFTEAAVSSRYSSVSELRKGLEDLHARLSDEATIPLGDRQLPHSKKDIELWLRHADDPIRDFDEEKA